MALKKYSKVKFQSFTHDQILFGIWHLDFYNIFGMICVYQYHKNHLESIGSASEKNHSHIQIISFSFLHIKILFCICSSYTQRVRAICFFKIVKLSNTRDYYIDLGFFFFILVLILKSTCYFR